MNSVVSEPVLIGIDWGTTSLRAFLIDSDGQVVDGASSSEGISKYLGNPLRQSLIASLVLGLRNPIFQSSHQE